MAVTRLQDVIVPEQFETFMAQNTKISTALLDNGVIESNPVLQNQLSTGGNIVNIPAWLDVVSPENVDVDPNVSSDDPSVQATPNAIKAVDFVSRISYLNNSWGAASLAGTLAGSDPMQRVAERVAAYWKNVYNRRLIASLYGIMLSNVANSDGDMTVDLTAASSGSPVVINGTSYTSGTIQRNAVVDAAFTMGDRSSDIGAIGMSSAVYRDCVKNNEIEFIRDSENDLMFPTYAGKAVFQDDGLALNNGNHLVVLFGQGSVAFVEGPTSRNVPLETYRYPLAGNGAGSEILVSRRDSIVAPYGWSFNSASVSLPSPVLADLSNPVNWKRVSPERKQCPIAFLLVKA
ncbi:MAG: hypothetical protein FWD64_02225 [Acidobacteriaceae bacterium]|nr:hypothetical protein [Acidobacteriaceae bacterium]